MVHACVAMGMKTLIQSREVALGTGQVDWTTGEWEH